MSVFTIIKRGRQQAKEHSQKQAAQKQKEDAKVPYKHVPTHAAVDAMAGAPSTWRAEDKPRIIEEHRRRSAMAATGMSGSSARIPRVSSNLSHVMYPAEHANPMIHMQRSYSYSGPAPWQQQYNRNSLSTPGYPPVPQLPRVSSIKGKEIERMMKPRGSRSSSRMSRGPPSLASSSNSIMEEYLEMKSVERGRTAAKQPVTMSMPNSRQSSRAPSVNGVHQPRPSGPRNPSDASIDKLFSGSCSSTRSPYPPSASRDSRPPMSMRGFGSIPPVPPLPPRSLQRPVDLSLTMPVESSVASSSSSLSSEETSSSAFRTPPTHSRSSPTTSISSVESSPSLKDAPLSIPTGVPVPRKGYFDKAPRETTAASGSTTPREQSPRPVSELSRPESPMRKGSLKAPSSPGMAPQGATDKDHKIAKKTRFAEVDVAKPIKGVSPVSGKPIRASMVLPTAVASPVEAEQGSVKSETKKKKLTKKAKPSESDEPPKRRRWSSFLMGRT